MIINYQSEKEVDRMPFVQKLPEWNKVGVEPPQSLKDGGWAANQKPPADYFNWQWNLVYLALKELQDNGYTKEEVEQVASALANAVQANLTSHLNDKNNPHGVTKAQVGLGNVDNVQQAAKTDFDAHNNDNVRHVTQADKDRWNAMLPAANYTAADVLNKIKSVDGSGSGLDADTLDGKDSSAFAQSAFSNVKVGSTTVAADSPNDTIELVAGSNVTLTPDATNDKVTISANVPVSSVNGKTGSVSLSATDVGAAPATHTHAIADVTGLQAVLDSKETPDGAQAKANTAETNAINFAKGFGLGTFAKDISNFDLNTITNGGFYRGSNITNAPTTGTYHIIVTSYDSNATVQMAFATGSTLIYLRRKSGGTWTSWKQIATTDTATPSTDGLLSAADKSKLDGIATGAEVNQNAFSNVKVGSTTVAADSETDTLELVAGSNITLTPDDTNDKVTIAANVPVSSVNGKTGAVNLTPADVGAVASFSLPPVSASTSWVKIAELDTNIGAGENGLILYLNGIANFGGNMPGVDLLQVSTRASVGLKAYRLIPGSTNAVTYGYVNNSTTGKTEIWLKQYLYCPLATDLKKPCTLQLCLKILLIKHPL
jgi:hypothetical protein